MRLRVVAPTAFAVACLVLVCLNVAAAGSGPSDAQVLKIARDVRTSPGDLPRLEVVVDGKTAPLPLRHTHVFAELSTHVAQVTVTQTYRNDFDRPIEARYVFPLPENSAVNHMQMQVGERTVIAEIQPRAEAKATFNAARQAGKTAALLEQERPNIFTQTVTNIPPGESVEITARFVQNLTYDAGMYEWVFPMVVGPRFIPGRRVRSATPGDGWAADTDDVPDASRITPPIIGQGMRTGHDIDIDVVIDSALPILDLQTPTHTVDAQSHDDQMMTLRLADGERLPNRDFVLRYQVGDDTPRVAVQARGSDGNGHFALTIQPPQLDVDTLVGHRELIFVVDVSGSMRGGPLRQAKAAARTAIRQLRPGDTFNLYTFAGRTGQAFAAPRPANETNIDAALAFLTGARAGGGTLMGKAVDAALSPPVEDGRHRYVVFMTDGYIGNETAMFSKASGLVSALEAKGQRARVFALGIGNRVNRHLITRLGDAGKGLGLVLTLSEHEGTSVRRIYQLIDEPVLRDIVIDWGDLPVADVYPSALPDVLASRPLVLHGRYAQASEGVVTVRGIANDGTPMRFTVPVKLPAHTTHGAAISSLWARARIEDLSRALWHGHDQAAVDAITATGLEHRLVTAYTSFVAVDDGQVIDRAPVPIVQPVELTGEAEEEGAFADVAATAQTAALRNALRRGPLLRATGFDNKLNAALSGTGDALAVGRGTGGMGLRGIGPDGGGEGFGRIHGIGRIDTGGGRGTRARRRPRQERQSASASVGKISVVGDIATADVERVVRRRIRGVTYCYEKALARSPWLTGKLHVKVSIGADGKVSKATLMSSMLKNRSVEGCVLRQIKRWAFPKPADGKPAVFSWPFGFSTTPADKTRSRPAQ